MRLLPALISSLVNLHGASPLPGAPRACCRWQEADPRLRWMIRPDGGQTAEGAQQKERSSPAMLAVPALPERATATSLARCPLPVLLPCQGCLCRGIPHA